MTPPMTEDIKRLESYRVRFVGSPETGVQAIEINGRFRTIGAVARLIERLAPFTTKETDHG